MPALALGGFKACFVLSGFYLLCWQVVWVHLLLASDYDPREMLRREVVCLCSRVRVSVVCIRVFCSALQASLPPWAPVPAGAPTGLPEPGRTAQLSEFTLGCPNPDRHSGLSPSWPGDELRLIQVRTWQTPKGWIGPRLVGRIPWDWVAKGAPKANPTFPCQEVLLLPAAVLSRGRG